MAGCTADCKVGYTVDCKADCTADYTEAPVDSVGPEDMDSLDMAMDKDFQDVDMVPDNQGRLGQGVDLDNLVRRVPVHLGRHDLGRLGPDLGKALVHLDMDVVVSDPASDTERWPQDSRS